jgi:uncharacterized Zn-binding protein involved in type VI secretion
MPPAARIADPTAHGAPLAPGPGSANVLIGYMPAWRATIDQHACPMVSISGADGVGSVLMGSPTVLINNMMACRLGDIVVEKPGLAAGPMNPIVMGCPTVMIGEFAAGGAGTPLGGAMAQAKASAASYCQTDGSGQVLGDEIPSQAGAAGAQNSADNTNQVTAGTTSQPGAQDPELHWVGIRIVNDQGDDLSGEELHGNTTDGVQQQQDVSSGVRFTEIPGGSCKFKFPKFYDEMNNWDPSAEV